MENMIDKKVLVGGEIMTIIRVSNVTQGYFARLERTGEEFYIADFQIEKIMGDK